MGAWVVGVQAEGSLSDFYGNAKCATFGGPTSGTCNSKVDSIGMVTGRLGRAYGKFLLYGDAGVAWAHDKYAVKSFTVGPFDYNGSQTRMGWTLGTGIAYAMTPNWSIFGEYNYLSFGEKTVTLNDPVFGSSNVNIGQRLNVFKVGANYKFN